MALAFPRFVENNPVNYIDQMGLFRLFGQSFVMPWDPNAGGIGDTLGAYGRAAGVAAPGAAAGAAAGAVTGATAGAVVGSFSGNPGGVLAGATAGAYSGAVSGGVSGLISSAFGDASDGWGAGGQALIPGPAGAVGAFSKVVRPMGGLGGPGGVAMEATGGVTVVVAAPGAVQAGGRIVGDATGVVAGWMFSTTGNPADGTCPTGGNPYLAGRTPLPGTRSTGVRRAAKAEVDLVKRTGKGTIDWTPDEIACIQSEDRLPQDIVGHHINNVEQFPEWAGDPRNIKFVRGQMGNLAEHGGNFQNGTTGSLFDR